MASPEVITSVTPEESFKPFTILGEDRTILVHITPDKTLSFVPQSLTRTKRASEARLFMGEVLREPELGLDGLSEIKQRVVRFYLGMDDGSPATFRQAEKKLATNHACLKFNSALDELGCSELYPSLLDFSKRPLKRHPDNQPTHDVQEAVVDEETLVRKAQEGDEGALVALYGSYYPRVYRYTLSRGVNETDAEDLAQEVFSRIAEYLPNFTSRGIPFSVWVFKIARNAIVSKLRRLGGVETTEIPFNLADERQNIEQETVGKLDLLRDIARLKQAMPLLTKNQRQVIELRFFADLSVNKTANVLGKSEANVKVTQVQAIAKLKCILSGEYFVRGRAREARMRALEEIRRQRRFRKEREKMARESRRQERQANLLGTRILEALINSERPLTSKQLAKQVNSTPNSVKSRIIELRREERVPIKNQLGVGYYIEIEEK